MAIATIEATKTYTPGAYLALETESETRSEYRNGEIVPMTGGTPTHNEITNNLNVLLRTSLKGQPYRIFLLDQRLWVPDRKLYTYPDVMVVPRPVLLQTGRKDTITNPIFIAEVLSNSTKNYDRGEKFAAYRTIPTFQEYLLVDQYGICVEHYVKQNANQWLLTACDRPDTKISLASISVQLSLADLYEDVEL